jgi:WD repeat-containing protein 19
MEWDARGEVLAVLQHQNAQIWLWEAARRKEKVLETNLRDPTWAAWNKIGSQLAVGTAKGNLFLYDKATGQTLPIVGKHQKKISSGCWNADNYLALGSADGNVTVSKIDGVEITNSSNLECETVPLQSEPDDMVFSNMKESGPNGPAQSSKMRSTRAAKTLSINMSHKHLLLYSLANKDNPVELAFQGRYGDIVSYHWFGDGYIMLAFSHGHVVSISTHMEEIGYARAASF